MFLVGKVCKDRVTAGTLKTGLSWLSKLGADVERKVANNYGGAQPRR